MSTVSSKKSQQNKVVFILLAVAAVIMLVSLAVFGYLILSSFGDSGGMTVNTGKSGMQRGGTFAKGDSASLMKPDEVMKAFLNEVGSEQLEDAYDRTSRGFRSAMSQAEFNDYIRKNKPLLGYTKLVFKGATKTGGMMIYKGHVGGGPNGGADYTLEVSQEEDGWKVAKFTVP